MSKREIAMALSAVAILSCICGMFGCEKTPKYTVDDIHSISISCAHMDYSHCYAFYVRNSENGWIFDADFATDTESLHTIFENCSVTDEDVKELLAIVRDGELVKKLSRSKKRKTKIHVSDETTYYTSIMFSDGEKIGASVFASQDLEDCFYRLAEKYAGTIT